MNKQSVLNEICGSQGDQYNVNVVLGFGAVWFTLTDSLSLSFRLSNPTYALYFPALSLQEFLDQLSKYKLLKNDSVP
jgi:hypothetical protein